MFLCEILIAFSLFQIISGQYVSTNHTASTYIEVEVIGIPVDCVKHKTKVVSRNALNPIWNDLFSFQVSKLLWVSKKLFIDSYQYLLLGV